MLRAVVDVDRSRHELELEIRNVLVVSFFHALLIVARMKMSR